MADENKLETQIAVLATKLDALTAKFEQYLEGERDHRKALERKQEDFERASNERFNNQSARMDTLQKTIGDQQIQLANIKLLGAIVTFLVPIATTVILFLLEQK